VGMPKDSGGQGLGRASRGARGDGGKIQSVQRQQLGTDGVSAISRCDPYQSSLGSDIERTGSPEIATVLLFGEPEHDTLEPQGGETPLLFRDWWGWEQYCTI